MNYEYSKARTEIETFFWKDFCDNYLESVKKIVYQGNESDKQSVKYTLYRSLLTILKLIAPIMPFITEEVYLQHFKGTEKEKSIHISGWPKPEKEKYKGHWDVFKEYLSMVNKYKSDNKMSLNTSLGYVALPAKDYDKIISTYPERFASVSGASTFGSGEQFKIEENDKQ